MKALAIDMTREQDRQIAAAVEQQGSRLRNFIRRRVSDPGEVEDILQDVFLELVEAYRLIKPIEQAGAWLFRVARNRIIDRFRKKRPNLVIGIRDSVQGRRNALDRRAPSLTKCRAGSDLRAAIADRCD